MHVERLNDMNSREKFIRVLKFEKMEEVPFPSLFYVFHPETLKRWWREGLPRDVHIVDYLGLERCELVPINVASLPSYEATGLEEAEEWKLGLDRSSLESVEAEIKVVEEQFPISYDSYGCFKELLNPDSPARYPRFWEDYLRRVRDRDYPLGISLGSPISWLVEWIGPKRVASSLESNPSWVMGIVDDLTEFILSTLRRALNDLRLDFAIFTEERLYRLASMASTNKIVELCRRAYSPVASWVRKTGVDLIGIDAQGYISDLLEVWIETGINFASLEASSGGDLELISKATENRFAILGNIDRRVLGWSKRDIADEVSRKMFFFEQGGYIPAPDGIIMPDASWENFKYFISLLKNYRSGGI